ncbi:MAG: hypothetical protein ACXWDF_12050, partial [Aeromicrobium sp.]
MTGQVDPADRKEDRSWEVADRKEDRAWKVDDRTEDRGWVESDRYADEAIALRKLAYETENDRAKTIHDERVAIVKAAFERAQAGAEFVRNAAAGILAIYELVLGLAFVAGSRALPLSGVLGTVFLALAVAAATGYVALLSEAPSIAPPEGDLSLKIYQERRLNAFTKWVSQAVLQRAYFLHMAVTSLFVGASALPLPFVQLGKVDFNDPPVFAVLLVVGLA